MSVLNSRFAGLYDPYVRRGREFYSMQVIISGSDDLLSLGITRQLIIQMKESYESLFSDHFFMKRTLFNGLWLLVIGIDQTSGEEIAVPSIPIYIDGPNITPYMFNCTGETAYYNDSINGIQKINLTRNCSTKELYISREYFDSKNIYYKII